MLAACVISPEQGTKVLSTSQPIDFNGYVWSPSDKIYLDVWVTTVNDGYEIGNGYWLNSVATTTGDATPSLNHFSTDLYFWELSATIPAALWEPGLQGEQVYVRLRSDTDNYPLLTFDDSSYAITTCLGDSSGWSEFQSQCSAERSPALRLETEDFVPFADRAKVDCGYRGNDCTSCVEDVENEFAAVYRDQLAGPTFEVDMTPAPPSGSGVTNLSNHFQGVGRLSNYDLGYPYQMGNAHPVVGRLVFSRDRPSQLFVVAEETFVASGEPEFTSTIGSLYDRIDIDSELNHPGGVWAANDLVAVGMECKGCEFDYNEVIFYRAQEDGFTLTEVNRLIMDGSQGENFPSNNNAAAVAFIRLRGGRFLLAVAGRGNGADGIRFYLSDREHIEPATQWNFLSHWVPDCFDESSDGDPSCFAGASALALFAQCDGKIYIVAMHGATSLGGPPPEPFVESWATLRRIVQDPLTGEIDFSVGSFRHINGPDGPFLGGMTHRWAGTLQVSETRGLVGMMSDRDVQLQSLWVARYTEL